MGGAGGRGRGSAGVCIGVSVWVWVWVWCVYWCVHLCLRVRAVILAVNAHTHSISHTHTLSHTHDAHNAHAEMKLSKDGSGAVGGARGDSQVGHRGENERERERERGTGGDSGQDSLAAEKRKQKSWENWLPIPGNLDNLPHNRA